MMYSEYKNLVKRLENHYQELHRETNAILARQLDPLISQYDQDIETLVERSIQVNISLDERKKIEELQKERANQLFDESSIFVAEHDRMIKILNAKFQIARRFIQNRYLEENKLNDE